MARQIAIGSLSSVPIGEGRCFVVGDREIAVFRTRDGQVFATQARCPHRQGPLIDGLLGGTHLTCPLHEWTFDLTSGKAIAGERGIELFPITCRPDGTMLLQCE